MSSNEGSASHGREVISSHTSPALAAHTGLSLWRHKKDKQAASTFISCAYVSQMAHLVYR